MFGDLMKMLGDANELRKKAAEVEKELTATIIEGSSKNGLVVVRVNAKFEVLDVRVDDSVSGKPSSEIASLTREALSNASAQVRKVTAEKMRALTGGMSVPGLF